MNKNSNSAVHIHLNTFENQSRVLKETKSLIDHNIVDKIIVVAQGNESLEGFEQIDENRAVYRSRSHIIRRYLSKNELPHGYGLYTLIHYVELFKFVIDMIRIVRNEKPVFINLHKIHLLKYIPFLKIVSPQSKLIYDTHELETETNGLRGWRKKFYKLQEKLFIKSFDHVFVVSSSIENWYRKTYSISNVTTIMNCPYPRAIHESNIFRKELGIDEESLIFIYQGGLSEVRGISLLLNAFIELNDPMYNIVFMGYGDLEDKIKSASKMHDNIYFYDAVPPDRVLEYTASADVGLHAIKNTCLNHNYCLPNKLFEYLTAGIPCIVPDLFEMSKYIKEERAGFLFKQEVIGDLIQEIKNISKEDGMLLKQNILETQKKYNWINEEKKMIRVYVNIINGKSEINNISIAQSA